MSEELKSACVIYKQLIDFNRHLTAAFVDIAGARIDSVDEQFVRSSILDMYGAMNLIRKEAILLEQEWRGYYVARGGKLEDIQPIISKSEQS